MRSLMRLRIEPPEQTHAPNQDGFAHPASRKPRGVALQILSCHHILHDDMISCMMTLIARFHSSPLIRSARRRGGGGGADDRARPYPPPHNGAPTIQPSPRCANDATNLSPDAKQ